VSYIYLTVFTCDRCGRRKAVVDDRFTGVMGRPCNWREVDLSLVCPGCLEDINDFIVGDKVRKFAENVEGFPYDKMP